ncbi:MAG: phage terminase small subunit P27 family [Cypionkella sp.]
MRGRKPKPTAIKVLEGNPGKRPVNPAEPQPPGSQPDAPPHLCAEARAEWDRLAESLNRIGLLTQIDRATMAAYCQCYGRWVEAELKLSETPPILRMPSGYIQQSPWLTISNKQLELMARFMAELGLTPASRSRLAVLVPSVRDPWENDIHGLLARPSNDWPTRIIIEPAGPQHQAGQTAPRPGAITVTARDADLEN